MQPNRMTTRVGVQIGVSKTSEGYSLIFRPQVNALELTTPEAHELAVKLLGGKSIPTFLESLEAAGVYDFRSLSEYMRIGKVTGGQ